MTTAQIVGLVADVVVIVSAVFIGVKAIQIARTIREIQELRRRLK